MGKVQVMRTVGGARRGKDLERVWALSEAETIAQSEGEKEDEKDAEPRLQH